MKQRKLNHQVCCIELFINFCVSFKAIATLTCTCVCGRTVLLSISLLTGWESDTAHQAGILDLAVIIHQVDDILSYLTHYIFAIVLLTLHFVAIVCIFTSSNDHFLNLIISSYRTWLSPCISNTTSHIILVSCVLFNNGLMLLLPCKSKRRSLKC